MRNLGEGVKKRRRGSISKGYTKELRDSLATVIRGSGFPGKILNIRMEQAQAWDRAYHQHLIYMTSQRLAYAPESEKKEAQIALDRIKRMDYLYRWVQVLVGDAEPGCCAVELGQPRCGKPALYSFRKQGLCRAHRDVAVVLSQRLDTARIDRKLAARQAGFERQMQRKAQTHIPKRVRKLNGSR